ncbi:MAG: hypothetical protein ACREBS_04555 [Nitrososphaerales archaeon]
MRVSSPMPPEWTFYTIGILLVILGVAFFMIPLLARSGVFSGIRVPWIILYTYNKNGFYFVTSPLLIIGSAVGFIFFILRR